MKTRLRGWDSILVMAHQGGLGVWEGQGQCQVWAEPWALWEVRWRGTGGWVRVPVVEDKASAGRCGWRRGLGGAGGRRDRAWGGRATGLKGGKKEFQCWRLAGPGTAMLCGEGETFLSL